MSDKCEKCGMRAVDVDVDVKVDVDVEVEAVELDSIASWEWIAEEARADAEAAYCETIGASCTAPAVGACEWAFACPSVLRSSRPIPGFGRDILLI